MTDLRRHIPPVALTWDDEAPQTSWRVLDGTLVFADISGFTALTERLAARGRIGAEEIIETLNQVFAAMVRAAAGRGGELLKFGGDALFFFFHGPGHVDRACDTAIGMRAELRRAAAEPTSVGRLRLSMSVGVHAGEIHLFLVGAPTRELFVLGPAADAVVAAEESAEAGQIVVTPATAARLPARAVRCSADGRLLLVRRSPTSTAAPTPALPQVPRARLSTLFPALLGEHLDPGPPDPEHRTATIAFCRFSGTDALLAKEGPEAVAHALGSTLSMLEAALAPERVTLLAVDLDADGGRFFLASGVPRASEDDEGRMLRALQQFLASGPPLPVGAGVSRGHVFAAEVGADFRAAYSAMGDTTNTAARIMARAPAGSVLAHPAVLEHARTGFVAQPRGPFAMKGKAAPLLVHEVGAPTGPRDPRGATRLPFVARTAELEQFAAVIDRAGAGRGGSVVVTGAAGLGKSRLVHQAWEQATGMVQWNLRAEPYGAASPYRVFREPLRRLLGITAADPVTLGEQLVHALQERAPQLLPLSPLLADVIAAQVPETPEAAALDPQYRPDRLADAVVELADAVVAAPLALVVEDAHWADAASVGLLDRIAAAATERPWVVVAVRREGATGGFDPAPATRIVVDPLPPRAVEQLVLAATAAAPLRPHDVETLVDRAQGNPLFVAEAVRARGSGAVDALPDSLTAVLASQIDALPLAARRLLKVGAVLGRSFRTVVLESVLRALDVEPDASVLNGLDAFLAPDGPDRLRFRSALLRDAAYEELAYRMRARLHAQAGLAIEQLSRNATADAATLAVHFAAAGDQERTWRYSRVAADAARAAYANADAAAQYERAIEAGRRLESVGAEELARTWSVLGDVLELAGVLDRSAEAFRKAASLTADPVARAEILVRQARVAERSGAYAPALRLLARSRRLLALAPAGDPGAERIAGRLDTLAALVRLGQERPQRARHWAVRAVEVTRRSGDAEALVQALMAIDYADLMLGRPGVGDHTREALQICIANGFRPRESVARANLGGYAFFAGRWPEAVQWYRSSREVALAAGNAFGAAETDLSLADIWLHQGRLDDAEAAVADAVRVLGASGVEFSRRYGDLLHAYITLARGDVAQAQALAHEVGQQFDAMGHRVSAYESALLEAECAVVAGAPQQALDLIGAGESVAGGDAAALVARAGLLRGRALAALGRGQEALAAVDGALEAAREQNLPYDEARLLQVRAGLSGDADDDARARGILVGLGAPV